MAGEIINRLKSGQMLGYWNALCLKAGMYDLLQGIKNSCPQDSFHSKHVD